MATGTPTWKKWSVSPRMLIVLIAAIGLAGLGGFLLADPPKDDVQERSQAERRGLLSMAQKHMVRIKALLQDFRTRHGRYPTTDEGLAVLDGFAARFPVPAFYVGWSGSGRSIVFWPEFWWSGAGSSNEYLCNYRREKGRLPASLEETAGSNLRRAISSGLFEESCRQQVDLGVDASDRIYALTPAGVLSPWAIPYVYENRSGQDARAFAGSPADADTQRRYSVEADKGVYVYSLGDQSLAERIDAAEQPAGGRWASRIAGGGLFAGSTGRGGAVALARLSLQEGPRPGNRAAFGGGRVRRQSQAGGCLYLLCALPRLQCAP
ncbi:MAG: hypothetical protein WCK05_00295 [Planctomycetota bacterium]